MLAVAYQYAVVLPIRKGDYIPVKQSGAMNKSRRLARCTCRPPSVDYGQAPEGTRDVNLGCG